jgi:hypothetical protein
MFFVLIDRMIPGVIHGFKREFRLEAVDTSSLHVSSTISENWKTVVSKLWLFVISSFVWCWSSSTLAIQKSYLAMVVDKGFTDGSEGVRFVMHTRGRWWEIGSLMVKLFTMLSNEFVKILSIQV